MSKPNFKMIALRINQSFLIKVNIALF